MLLVCVDHYTAAVKVMWCQTQQFAEAAVWMYTNYASKGVEIIHTDNGKPFLSNVMRELLRVCGARAAHGRPYNPRKFAVV